MALRRGVYNYLNPAQRLARAEWPWEEGPRSRLPDHFKRRYIERHQHLPKPVHWIPNPKKWEIDEFGVRTHVENIPIPTIMPPVADKALWGGEGFVQGFRRKGDDPVKPAVPKIWKPRLVKRVFYSEILDKWFAIQVTFTTIELVDKAYGFDSYILQTPEKDLKSKLGMKMKADMIRTLIHKSMYPNNPARCDQIYEKYKEFIVPEEELEWYGLDIDEAEEKQRNLELEERESSIEPYKNIFMRQLRQDLLDGKYADLKEDGSVLSKLNPFKSKAEQKKGDLDSR